MIDFHVYRRELVDLRCFVELALRGLTNYDWTPPQFWELEEESDKRAFAASQEQEGFAYLYHLGVIRIWTVLETIVDDLVLDRLRQPEFIVDSVEGADKIKVDLVKFYKASEEERTDLVLYELKKKSSGPGASAFESLLTQVGLGEQLPDVVKETLREACEVRNLLVHRNGVLDRRFTKSCPRMAQRADADPQKKLVLEQADHERYWLASLWYVHELARRCDEEIALFEGEGREALASLERIDREYRMGGTEVP